MARTQTMVQLNDELVEMLDEYAARAGVSRSQVIREAVESFLAADLSAVMDRRIVDGYTRMPQSGEYDEDEWGSVGNLMAALTVNHMSWLNAEEDDAGHAPW